MARRSTQVPKQDEQHWTPEQRPGGEQVTVRVEEIEIERRDRTLVHHDKECHQIATACVTAITERLGGECQRGLDVLLENDPKPR